MFSVKRCAEVFGVNDAVAGGLLRFLADTGVVQTELEAKVPGRKGRAATLYRLDAEAIARMSALFTAKLVPGAVPVVVAPPAPVAVA